MDYSKHIIECVYFSLFMQMIKWWWDCNIVSAHSGVTTSSGHAHSGIKHLKDLQTKQLDRQIE